MIHYLYDTMIPFSKFEYTSVKIFGNKFVDVHKMGVHKMGVHISEDFQN
jgi:hypothetical protein